MNLAAELEAINAEPLNELKMRWRRRHRRDPPAGLSPKLLREVFIYALQEDRFGGLSSKARRRLDVLSAKIEADPTASVCGDGSLRPGALLVREWRGKRFEVEVLETGFGMNGETYASLSEIAHVITGTKWSGPQFFGLNKRSSR